MEPGLHLAILSFFTVLMLNLRRTSALMFELPDKQEMCFYEDYEGLDNWIVEYKVIRGGKNDVDVSLTSPGGKSIYKKTKKRQDKFSFESSHGKWSLCFGNTFSTVTHKLVYFNIRPEFVGNQRKKIGSNQASVDTKSENMMENIYQNNEKVMGYQVNYRTNEARGRFAAEELNNRILWWSMWEGLIILFSSLGQVFVLRRFFNDVRPKKAQNSIGALTPPMSMPVNKL